MGKKTTTKTEQKNVFDPASKSAYDAYTSNIQQALLPLINDPFGGPLFNLWLQNMQKQTSQSQGRNARNIMQNAGQFSLNNPGAFQASQLARNSRGTSAMQQNALFNAFQMANQNRFNAMQLGQSFNPLLTGQNTTSVQKTSGLGTWLPQVAGIAASIGLAPFTGGASLAGMGGFLGGKGNGGMAASTLPGSAASYQNALNTPFNNMAPGSGTSPGNYWNPWGH